MASVNRAPEKHLLGERDDWSLHIGDSNSSGWAAVRLVHMTARKGSIPKRSFHLGWNGARLAEGKDFRILNSHYPDLLKWVRSCLSQKEGRMTDTKTETSASPLVGKCFVIFGSDSEWSRQGVVRADLGRGYFLVQFFEALMGTLSTSAIFHISEMVDQSRAKGGWEFFEDDTHLREWIEARQ